MSLGLHTDEPDAIFSTQTKTVAARVEKWSAKILFRFLFFYLGSYFLLAAFGGYRLVIMGRYHDPGAPTLLLPDTKRWMPAFVWNKRRPGKGQDLYANIPGYFYHPLVVLDRELFHPSLNYDDEIRMWMGLKRALFGKKHCPYISRSGGGGRS